MLPHTALSRVWQGLWVIVTAKARFPAGESYPKEPDVFHDEVLAAQEFKVVRSM